VRDVRTARLSPALVGALLWAGCARSSSRGGDAGPEADAGCPPNQCEAEGRCILPTVCHPLLPGRVCAAGRWLATCNNGVCDCGEGPVQCPQDCDCPDGTCPTDDGCVDPGTCEPGQDGSACTADGVFDTSCGNGGCDCGETADSCPVDCAPEGPHWSPCVGRTVTVGSCAEYCGSIGLTCVDDCTTTLGRPAWGAEAWPSGQDCLGRGEGQALCADTWVDRVGDEPRWECCCER
jgi:hypothetical protein